MFKIDTEEAFRELFRPIDQEEVTLPDDFVFPLLIRGTLAWLEPGGIRTYLVFEDLEKKAPRGIVFHRKTSGSDVPASMCDFCHSIRGGSAVGMLTANVSKKTKVGVNACKDLSCQAYLESTVPGKNDMRETYRPDQKRHFLLERIGEFARRNLFLSEGLLH